MTPETVLRRVLLGLVGLLLSTAGLLAATLPAQADEAPKVLLLLDVSGSMSPYADALLRFAHVAVRARPATTEVFTVGTRLTRVTRELRLRDPDRALAAGGAAIPDWSGGTRLGEVLKAFLDRWGQRGTARGLRGLPRPHRHPQGPGAHLEAPGLRRRHRGVGRHAVGPDLPAGGPAPTYARRHGPALARAQRRGDARRDAVGRLGRP